jgi:hypothetical protein
MDQQVHFERNTFTKVFKYSIVFLLLLVAFRTLIKFPFKAVYFQAEFVFEIFLILFLFVYCMDKIFTKKRFQLFEIFLLLILLAPFYSGLLAQFRFNQPIGYGILAQRSYILSVCGLLLYYLLKIKFIFYEDLKKIFLLTSWFCLISYLLLVVLIPKDYMDNSIVSFNESKGGEVYRFDVAILVLGFFFYFISGIKQNNSKHLIYAAIFIAYIIFFHKGRGLLLSIIGSLMLFFTLRVSLVKKVKYTFYAIIILIVSFVSVRVIFPDLLDGYVKSYSNLLDVVSGKSTGEASADSRIFQVALVQDYWKGDLSKIIFGSGTLSNQWNGGFKKQLGYFYYVDIGWYGIVFVFGIVGLIIFKLQYVLFVKYFKAIKKLQPVEDNFLTALKYYLLFVFFKSFMNGEDTFEIQENFLIMCICAFVLTSEKSNNPTLQPVQ